MKKILLPLLILSIGLFSCEKEETPPKEVCVLSDASLVGTYKLTAVIYKKDANTPPVDELASYPACELDDEVVFTANKGISFNDKGVACDPPNNNSTYWSISGNTINFGPDPFIVSEFTCTGFTGVFPGDAPGETTTVTLTRK